MDHQADIAILGAGPAGCTLATRLSRAGWDVALVDARPEPLATVGESLLPWCGRVLDRLGVSMDGFQVKRGAVFAWDEGAARFDFSGATRPERPVAWEVPRDEFDRRLRAVAADAGARFLNARAEGFRPGELHTDQGGVAAPFVVDAGGRRQLLARQMGLRQTDPTLRNAAIAAVFEGVANLPPAVPGDITICPFDTGWFWFIPFADGRTSVGMVTTPESDLSGDRMAQGLARCPEARRRLEGARAVGPRRGHQDFTATASRLWGDGWALVGDAGIFLDPVFSSGVLFALESADGLADALLQPAPDRKAALADWERSLRRASELMYQAIRAFYDEVFKPVALCPRELQSERIRRAILSLLAGDVLDPDSRAAAWIAPRFDQIADLVHRRQQSSA